MNYAIFTAKVIQNLGQSFFTDQTSVAELIVHLPQISKNYPRVIVQLSIWGNLSYDVAKYYQPDDYIIIEGYILFKNTTSYDWHIFDAARNTYNLTNSSLKADTTGAEYTNDDVSIDLLSNGFKLRGTDLAINGPSNTIIFAAFAEHPFKNANAR